MIDSSRRLYTWSKAEYSLSLKVMTLPVKVQPPMASSTSPCGRMPAFAAATETHLRSRLSQVVDSRMIPVSCLSYGKASRLSFAVRMAFWRLWPRTHEPALASATSEYPPVTSASSSIQLGIVKAAVYCSSLVPPSATFMISNLGSQASSSKRTVSPSAKPAVALMRSSRNARYTYASTPKVCARWALFGMRAGAAWELVERQRGGGGGGGDGDGGG